MAKKLLHDDELTRLADENRELLKRLTEMEQIIAERYAMDADIEGMIERLAWFEAMNMENQHAA